MRPSPRGHSCSDPGDGGSERCVQCGKLHAALRKLSRFRLTDVTSGGLSPQFRVFVGMSSSGKKRSRRRSRGENSASINSLAASR